MNGECPDQAVTADPKAPSRRREAGNEVVVTRWTLVLTASLFAAELAGCHSQDEIRRYQVPRVEGTKAKAPPRMLAAMLPHQEQMWFFKMVGPEQIVAEQKEKFEGFIGSIRFTDKGDVPLTWTVPEGWREEHKEANPANLPGLRRFATFHIGPEAAPIELTVLPLPRLGEAGSVLANFNRWRNQLGQPAVTEAELGKVTTEVKVGDAVATLVDISAPGSGDARAALAQRPAANVPLSFKTPEGWKPQAAGQFGLLAFQVTGDGKTAQVTVSLLPGNGGGLAANVNRWRTQLKLEGASEEQIRKDLREIAVAGVKAPYLDLLGPETGGQRKEILGVVVERDAQTWFFKMIGPAELVTRQKPAFEEFVRSVQFGAVKGGQR
jgi:hypothetical protein